MNPKRGLILDPRVRVEKDPDQALHVIDEEAIYRPCILHLSERYNLSPNALEVKGLPFGARGAAFTYTVNFLRELNITEQKNRKTCNGILRDSINILHNSLYTVL